MQRAPLGITKALAEVSTGLRSAASRGGAKLPHKVPPLHHAHRRPAPPAPVSAASPSHAAGRFIRAISEALFKPIKTSAYNHPHGPYTSSRLPPRPHFATGRRPAANAHRFGTGLSPRPVIRANTSQMGLGAARQFSSSQPVFAHLSNVPLALRALGGGVDDRKWRTVRKTVRAEMRTAGEQRKSVSAGLWMSKEQEMKRYFGSAAIAEVEQVAEIEQAQQPILGARLPVVLIIDVDPELSFVPSSPASSSASVADLDPSSWRLLTPSVVSSFATITASYERHAHKIRALNNRLLDAGVFDDPATEIELVVFREHDGRERKEVHVTFGTGWDVRDVRSIVGWTGGNWARVVDLEEDRAGKMRDSAELDASTLSSYSEEDEHESIEAHHAISSTFILPDPHSHSAASDSLELSPPLSPSLSCDDTLSWNDWQAAPELNSTASSYMEEEACPWEDARVQASADEASTSAMSSSYEQGVRTFLVELDRVSPRL